MHLHFLKQAYLKKILRNYMPTLKNGGLLLTGPRDVECLPYHHVVGNIPEVFNFIWSQLTSMILNITDR
jgi:hypothetical protein